MVVSRAQGHSPYEESICFSRAVRVGPMTAVSGTAAVEEDGSSTAGDVTAQTRRCFEIVFDALREIGVLPHDVIRTRMYLVNPEDAEAVGRVHAELFGEIRPAATMVVVKSLLRPEWRIEVEADAWSLGSGPSFPASPERDLA